MKSFFKNAYLKSVLLLSAAVLAFASMPATAGVSLATTTRTAEMASIITDLGATGAKLKLYNGCTIPTGVAAATGCTLLGTITWTGTVGTASASAITWDTAGITQTNSSHVTGIPTFAHLTTSGDVVKIRIDICGSAPCWTFTGSVTTGQNITLTGLTFTAGNP